jgi:formylglycine-generating enzyme required for sulfatase activity
MFPRILFVFIALTFLATARGDAPVDTFTNTLGMSFRRVPGTETLLCYWPTRVRDYRVFVKETGRKWPDPGFPQGDMHPAVCVTWEDAEAFASWLTPKEQAEGKLPASWKYRLPLETEWNIAIGLPPTSSGEESTTQVFPWGTQWPPPPGAGNYSPDLQVDPFPYTSPVASFKPNALGFFDMGGNVWQWCEDYFDRSADYRVLRGASWRMRDPDDLLSSKRIGNKPDTCLTVYGFRLAIEMAAPSPGSPAAPPSTNSAPVPGP